MQGYLDTVIAVGAPEYTTASLVLQGDQVVAEAYRDGLGSESPLKGFSMSKSFANLLVGRLAARGVVAVDDALLLPGWDQDQRSLVTWDRSLRMSSGLRWHEAALGPDNDQGQMFYNTADPAAYAASRIDFRRRQAVLVGLLAVQMISPLVILLPLYRWMNTLGLLNQHISVIAVYGALGMPLAVWLLKVAFDAIPVELEEAAAIDGASRPRILARITLPLARSGIASAFILAMVMNWSQFLIPFILLERDADWPISVAIFNFAGSVSASTTTATPAGP